MLPAPTAPGLRLAFATAVEAIRDGIDSRIRAAVKGDAGSIASALITGKRDALSAPVFDAMYISGVGHVLSISGYHMALVAGVVFFIVRAGSDIRTVADLRGRRVAVGMKTSGMVQHAHNIFGVLGLSFSDFTPVYLDFAAGADALALGEVDAQFQCPIPNRVMSDLVARQMMLAIAADYERLAEHVQRRITGDRNNPL